MEIPTVNHSSPGCGLHLEAMAMNSAYGCAARCVSEPGDWFMDKNTNAMVEISVNERESLMKLPV